MSGARDLVSWSLGLEGITTITDEENVLNYVCVFICLLMCIVVFVVVVWGCDFFSHVYCYFNDCPPFSIYTFPLFPKKPPTLLLIVCV